MMPVPGRVLDRQEIQKDPSHRGVLKRNFIQF